MLDTFFWIKLVYSLFSLFNDVVFLSMQITFSFPSLEAVFLWSCLPWKLSSMEVALNFSHLPLRLSLFEIVFRLSPFEGVFWVRITPHEVVFRLCCLLLRISSTEVVFHSSHLPFISSSIDLFFHWGHLSMRSSSIEVVFWDLPWSLNASEPKWRSGWRATSPSILDSNQTII